MNIIDAHHHLWDLSVFPYPWMNNPHPTGDISHLKKNYLVVWSLVLKSICFNLGDFCSIDYLY